MANNVDELAGGDNENGIDCSNRKQNAPSNASFLVQRPQRNRRTIDNVCLLERLHVRGKTDIKSESKSSRAETKERR